MTQQGIEWNGRRQMLRHQRGHLSAWEAICGLHPFEEQELTDEQWREIGRGNGQVIG